MKGEQMPKELALKKVRDALRGVGSRNISGDDWTCPGHDDHRASLTVKYGSKPGTVILACGAGCERASVLVKLGLRTRDLFDNAAKDSVVGPRLEYVYRDEDGGPLFQVVRTSYASGKKTFTQEASNGRGGWRRGRGAMDGVRRVLYRLPDLMDAIDEGYTVHLTEGEKDADALNEYFTANRIEAFATCHPAGAGKWQPAYTEQLARADAVVVWADRDGPGYRCAHQRLSAVLAAGLPVTTVLPVPNHKGADAHDHIGAGRSPDDATPVSGDELQQLAGEAASSDAESDFGPETWDDFGNAQRLVDRYADRLRWIVDNESWAVYDRDTGLWIPRKADSRAGGLARKTVERMVEEEAPNYSDTPGTSTKSKEASERDDWFRWAKSNRKDAATKAMLSQAKTKKSLHTYLARFDADPNVLHCANGVLDLQSLKLHPHSSERLCTISTGTPYVPDATDELWTAYLGLFIPDLELRGYVQRVLGYSLLDGNPERLFLLVNGRTSSGKSTLNEVVMATLGDYAKPFNMSAFRANQDEKPRSDVAGVLARRYISAVEASSEWHLHADQIKRLTGGDALSARFPYDRVDTVRVPAFVPFIFTNAVPTVNGRDRALDRRLLVLPFNEEVAPEDERPGAGAAMKRSSATRAAVLAWMVEGLRAYLAAGLGPRPEAVRAATENARRELSDLDRFLYRRCDFGEEKWAIPAELYDAYVKWCHVNRSQERDILSATAFGNALKNRGHEKVKGRDEDNKRVWVRRGLAIKEPSWKR